MLNWLLGLGAFMIVCVVLMDIVIAIACGSENKEEYKKSEDKKNGKYWR